VRHVELAVDLGVIGGSALTADIDVPKDRPLAAGDIPPTYVPARNTVFLSLALAWAEVIGARDIVIGVNALDYSGIPTAGRRSSRSSSASPPSRRGPAPKAPGFESERRCWPFRRPTSSAAVSRSASTTA